MKIFIGSSSSVELEAKYINDCQKYLLELYSNNHDLIFGACNKGIMGLAYKIAKENNRKIIGISPEIFKDDFKYLNCDLEITTNSIMERTNELIKNSDVLIFLPGGIGTIYELFTAIESKRSNEFNKPIIIYNSCHYFDELLIFMDKMYIEKFTSTKVKDCYHISNSIEDTINYLNNYSKKRIKK